MQEFAFLEFKLQSVISDCLGLNVAQGLILAKNMKYGDKVAACYSMAMLSATDEAQRTVYRRQFKKLFEIGTTRNFIAHTQFMETADGQAVSFFKIQARGDFDLPNADWTIELFEAEFEKMDEARKDLIALTAHLNAEKYRQTLIDALMKPSATSGGLFGTGPQGLLNFPPPDGPDCPPDASAQASGPSTPQ